jgi:hypothetical protein
MQTNKPSVHLPSSPRAPTSPPIFRTASASRECVERRGRRARGRPGRAASARARWPQWLGLWWVGWGCCGLQDRAAVAGAHAKLQACGGLQAPPSKVQSFAPHGLLVWPSSWAGARQSAIVVVLLADGFSHSCSLSIPTKISTKHATAHPNTPPSLHKNQIDVTWASLTTWAMSPTQLLMSSGAESTEILVSSVAMAALYCYSSPSCRPPRVRIRPPFLTR